MQELTNKAVEELKLIAPDLAQIINDEHTALLEDCQASRDKAESAKDRALRIGAALAKAKDAVGHGKFMGWVKVNCSFEQKTAQNYMHFANSYHDANLPDDLSLRAAMIALDIVPGRPRDQGTGNTYRGGGIPSVYDPLNKLTAFLGAVDNSGAAQEWETDPYERSAVQRQYKPKLEDFILRLYGMKVELPAVEA